MGRGAMSAGGQRSMTTFLCVFVTITLAAWHWGRTALARVPGPTTEEDLKSFMTDLSRFRSGDDSVLPQLHDTAERCANRHDRPDGQKILDFYLSMSHDDRVRGFDAQQEFEVIRDRVKRAGNQHVSIAEWSATYEEILDELGRFIPRTIKGPDFAPAAYALGLRSTLLSRRVRKDNHLDGEDRSQCILNGIEDARISVELFEQCGMRTPQIEPLLNQAWFEWARGQTDEAASTFTQVEKLARAARIVSYQARALSGLELIAAERGDVQRRCKLLIEMANLEPSGLPWDVVKEHGQLLLELDEPRMAAEWLATNRPTKDADLDWHFQMYSATSRAGMQEAATGHARAVRDSPNASQIGSAEWLAVAEMDLKAGQAEDVLRRLDQLDQTWIDYRRPAHIARIRGEAHLALHHYVEAADVLKGSLELSDLEEKRLVGVDTHSPGGSVVGETIGLESVAMLAHALLESEDALSAATEIENWQSRSLRLAAGADEDLTSEDVRSWASRYECGLVTWVIGADTSVVVHVTAKGRATGAWLQVGRHQLETAIRRLRETAREGDSVRAFRYADEIQSRILPRAMLDEVANCGRGRILLCTHGALEAMPIDLLPLFRNDSESTPTPLALPGLLSSPLETTWTTPADSSWCILGNPVATLPEDTIPGASKELDGVAGMHPGAKVCAGLDFDRDNVLASLSSHPCVHLASHLISGERGNTSIDDSMSRAAILLSRGERLGIRDIVEAHPKLDLAVLNACYTAGGEKLDAEPVQGISRAFLILGARNLVVTNWPIEDGAATTFALAFHRALNEGIPPSQAAVVARKTLRASGASPAEWAAFQVIGCD